MSTTTVPQLSILLVDDESFVLNLSLKVLKKLGYESVVTAGNGMAALEQLVGAQEPFDVVVCDLNMPEMDGVEFMRHAAEHDFTGGVIFLSGEDERILESARDLAKAHQLNILGVIPKPLNPAALKDMLGSFQPRARAQRAAQSPIAEAELRDGIRGEQLQLVYQPKVSIRTGEIIGVESLARWRHPQRGTLGPGTFIPLAEELGLIHELSDSIYQGAVAQAAEWLAGGAPLKTSVNFSINSFTRADFVDFLLKTAQAEGIGPSLIVLEVTESQLMHDALGCLEVLMRLRMKKFGLSIDDFGTGHSSLEQLKRIPFNELKIDRAFVYGAEKDAAARAILESSVELAHKLKLEIVAEGVETRSDWDVVEKLGCDYVQGYYCGKPMSPAELDDFRNSWTGPH